jgi:FkbM family methyltransferase
MNTQTMPDRPSIEPRTEPGTKQFSIAPWLRFVARKVWFHGTAYREAVENWYRVPLCVAFPRLSAGIRFRDGELFGPMEGSIWPRLETVVRWNLIQGHLGAHVEDSPTGMTLRLRHNQRDLRFLLRETPLEVAYQLYEVFDEEEYRESMVEGRTVVDVGANIGETALYFLLHKADRVIALEPNHNAFELAGPNLSLNGFDGEAIFLNVAGSDRDGEIRLDGRIRSNVNRPLEPQPAGRPIPTVSLPTLVERYALKHAVLKLDCEGAEYRILSCPTETLRGFSTILGEYHYGYAPIARRLKAAGFDVRETRRAAAFANPHSRDTMYVGAFHAEQH